MYRYVFALALAACIHTVAHAETVNEKLSRGLGSAAHPANNASNAVGSALDAQPGQTAAGQLSPTGTGTSPTDLSQSAPKSAATNVKKIYDGARSYHEEEFSGNRPSPKKLPDAASDARHAQDKRSNEMDAPATLQSATEPKKSLDSMRSNAMKPASESSAGPVGNKK